MKRGEVWWVAFDPAVGSEVQKTRPAIIVSNDSANRNLKRVIVVPLTTNTSRIFPGEARITVAGELCKAMSDQLMAADKLRLKDKLATLSKSDLLEVERAMCVHLGLPV
jgi:mRNA interferase MazF